MSEAEQAALTQEDLKDPAVVQQRNSYSKCMPAWKRKTQHERDRSDVIDFHFY